jgi:ribosomal protein S18 acetylase RimI-like enzyme
MLAPLLKTTVLFILPDLSISNNMNITIRRITIKDIGVIYQLGKSAPEFNVAPHSSGFWSQQALSSWLNKNDDPLLLAEEDGEIIGFILCQFHWPTGKATIENILVKKQYRGKGVGTQLLQSCLEALKTVGARYICALTKTDNISMLDFMSKRGFHKGFTFIWLDMT